MKKLSLLKSVKIISISLLLMFSSSIYAADKNVNTSKNNNFFSNITTVKSRSYTKSSFFKIFINKLLGLKLFKKTVNKLNIDKGTGTPASVPLDGELGILLLGAVAFGYKKLRGNKTQES